MKTFSRGVSLFGSIRSSSGVSGVSGVARRVGGLAGFLWGPSAAACVAGLESDVLLVGGAGVFAAVMACASARDVAGCGSGELLTGGSGLISL